MTAGLLVSFIIKYGIDYTSTHVLFRELSLVSAGSLTSRCQAPCSPEL